MDCTNTVNVHYHIRLVVLSLTEWIFIKLNSVWMTRKLFY